MELLLILIADFIFGFLVCGLLTVEMLKRKGLMNKESKILDMTKNPPEWN